MININEFKILNAPRTVYYVPNFISDDEEEYIINMVNNAPKPKWTQLAHRRLQNWGGIPHKNGMIAESIPAWLQRYIDRITELNVMPDMNKPNHVLINEYKRGEGILAHLDGNLFYPTVTTISCGSHTVLKFKRNNSENSDNSENDNDKDNDNRMMIDVCNLLLERKSLLILQDNMYHKYLHEIDTIDCDVINDQCINLQQCGAEQQYKIGDQLERSTRISLTIRHVPKTTRIRLFL